MNILSSRAQAGGQSWPEIEKLITREGKTVDISGDTWRLPYSARNNSTLNFTKIMNSKIREALKEHVAERLKRIATHAGYAAYQDVWREVLRHWVDPVSDLLQTEWFGRSNPRDTKAYQQTSREKRVLMLREDTEKGLVGNQLAE